MQQADFPPESPFVTSVGGTSLAIGRHDNYEFETSWGTLLDPLAKNHRSWKHTPPGVYPGSSGGGVSFDFAQPSYQKGVVPNTLATTLPDGSASPTPRRVEPDVSTLADPSTGILTGETTGREGLRRRHRGRLARPVHPVLLEVYVPPEPAWTAVTDRVWTGWAHASDVLAR